MEYKLKWPDVKGRKEIKAIDVKYGDVVAVAEFCRNSFTNEIEFGRTGLAVMESPDWAIWYINLCKEEGREWVNDPLPDDVMLFEPTEEEEYFGKLILLQELFNTYSNPFFNGQVITDTTIDKLIIALKQYRLYHSNDTASLAWLQVSLFTWLAIPV